jgi:hypothetical protein
MCVYLCKKLNILLIYAKDAQNVQILCKDAQVNAFLIIKFGYLNNRLYIYVLII